MQNIKSCEAPLRARLGRLACVGLLILGVIMVGSPAWAGKADVVAASAHREAAGVYRFDVTVRHDDQGWSHYADAWEVVAPDGKVLGRRTLFHPHENEQPFTRSLRGVQVPANVTWVTVRAFDKTHGGGGATQRVSLPKK